MVRTQSLRSLSLTALAFIIAALAQSEMHGWLLKSKYATQVGWGLYAIAAIPLILAFGRLSVSQFGLGRLSQFPETRARLSQRQWILVVCAVLAGAMSWLSFTRPESLSVAWELYAISLLLFVAGFISFAKPQLPSVATLGKWLLYSLPIVLILGIAVFARFWKLAEFPFGSWYDESINGLAAAQILTDPHYRPIFVDTMPSHFIYLISFAFSIFGVTPFALRLVTAAFGIAGVVFAYLLFKRWMGTGAAAVGAALLAVMRYDLTFSRFGVNAISVPVFVLAALYFLDRGLAHKRIADFAWLGLALGMGLSFYTAFRLFPVALVVFLLCLLVAAIVKQGWAFAIRNYIRDLSPHWLIAALALLLTLMPVLYFIARDPQEFFSRTRNVSILQKRDEPDLGKALWSNTRKHLEMFNVRGDNNGRHNLPAAPTLDPVMGVLFVLGFVYALWRWRDLSNLIMILVFVVMIQSGVLSLDFEAPQSLRAIGVIPSVVYFMTLPLAAIARTVDEFFELRVQSTETSLLTKFPYWQLGAVLLLAVVAYINFDTFFNKQQNDPSAWAEHSAGPTLVARILQEKKGEYDFILSAMYEGNPTVRFLAGETNDYPRWTVTDRLPLVRDPNRGVILLMDDTLLPAFHDIPRVYPNAQLIEHHPPAGGGAVLYEAILTPDDLKAAGGVVARYYSGDVVTGEPVKEEVLPQVALDWTTTQPLSEPFIAELRATLVLVEHGGYIFSLRGTPGAQLWIDENPVGDQLITLARGTHTLRLQVPGNVDKLELWWQTPNSPEPQLVPSVNLFRPSVPNSGLLGSYYPTANWSGEPAFTQVDPQIAFYFHITPLQRPYSAEWKGKLFIPTDGEYTFGLHSVDGSWLWLDSQPVVENPNGRTLIENTATLTAGWHDVLIRFQDQSGGTQIYWYWTPPGASEHELVPSRYLSPSMGQYPNPNVAEP